MAARDEEAAHGFGGGAFGQWRGPEDGGELGGNFLCSLIWRSDGCFHVHARWGGGEREVIGGFAGCGHDQ